MTLKSVIVFERVSPNRLVPFTLLRSAKPHFHTFKQLQTGQPITLVFPVIKIDKENAKVNSSNGYRVDELLNMVALMHKCE